MQVYVFYQFATSVFPKFFLGLCKLLINYGKYIKVLYSRSVSFLNTRLSRQPSYFGINSLKRIRNFKSCRNIKFQYPSKGMFPFISISFQVLPGNLAAYLYNTVQYFIEFSSLGLFRITYNNKMFTRVIYRGYYTVSKIYGFYLRVAKISHELSAAINIASRLNTA